ncbi:MAG: hypothetical protein WBC44_02320 [Planctomycetaceae bacterium]
MNDDRRWFHVTITTYGSWLPGDPRGFRTRHHREHVDGDYKRPPEEDYAGRHARSRKLCKVPPVLLTPAQRRLVVLAIHERLVGLGDTVITVGMSGRHGHVLGQFIPKDVRRQIGHAKQHAFCALREVGWSGFLWAKRCGVEPVKDRSHQINTLNYIVRHRRVRAYVWRWGDPIEDS